MTDKILLLGAEFFARHGVGDAERQVGGRYRVDVELETDLSRPGSSDALGDTISYTDVLAVVREQVEQTQVRLVERLAGRIAAILLERFPAEAVRVRVCKTPPPLPGIVQAAGVEVYRRRNAI